MTQGLDRYASARGARDVTAGYGHNTVLRGVTIMVRASSVSALLGLKGAGKTTLLKSVSVLLRPTSGSAVIDGRGRQQAGAVPSDRAGSVPHPRGPARSSVV